MTGAEITTVAAAESAQPGRAIAKMTTTVIWRILIFYVVSVFLIVSVVPWNTVRSGESPFTLALNTMHVPGASIIMSVIILTAVLSCLNSAFYVSSRVLFILAARGDAPQSFVKLNKRRVPVVSVLIGAAAGFLGIIAATEGAAKSIRFFIEFLGRAHCIRLYDHGCRANCIAPAARTQWRGEARDQHVVIPLPELRRNRLHGCGADRHGLHARPAARTSTPAALRWSWPSSLIGSCVGCGNPARLPRP